MIDISGKEEIERIAVAAGKIRLKEGTIRKIRQKQIKKGDALEVARVAAINAVKLTPFLVPMCHQIGITGVNVSFSLGKDEVEARVEVKAIARTGVEMEALAGVSAALLNILDMVKYLEKDEKGQYPTTEILGVKVIEKIKKAKGS